MSERKLLVGMSQLEYSQFVLLERLIRRLQAGKASFTDEQVVEVVEKSMEKILNQPAQASPKDGGKK